MSEHTFLTLTEMPYEDLFELRDKLRSDLANEMLLEQRMISEILSLQREVNIRKKGRRE